MSSACIRIHTQLCNLHLQVQLSANSVVRGVATQGRHVNPQDGCCYQKVTKYRVMYSVDCTNFDTVKDAQGNDIVRASLALQY